MRKLIPFLFLIFINQLVFADESNIDLSNCIITIPGGYSEKVSASGIRTIIYPRRLGSLEIGLLPYPNKLKLKTINNVPHGLISVITLSDQLPKEPYVIQLIQTSSQYVAINDRLPQKPKLSTLVISSCLSTLKN